MGAELDLEEGGVGAVKRKLSQNRGETLVEVLAAVLVASLSIALLFGGIMASSSLERTVQTEDETFFQDLSAAERQGSGDAIKDDRGSEKSIKVTVSRAGGSPSKESPSEGSQSKPDVTLTATVYGGKAVRSYAKKAGGT